MVHRLSTWLLLTLVAATVGACAPGGPAPGSRTEAAPAADGKPKVLRIGMLKEPGNFIEPGSGGPSLILDIADAQIMAIGSQGELIPRLVAEIPSVEKGTWTVLPDGGMEVTWKLRPNVRWHDGHQFTSDDVLFAWEYMNHPGSLMSKQAWVASVDRFSSPDPMTVILHFKRTYALVERIGKNTSDDFRPLPRHILGELLARGDIEAFNNSAHWRNDYIGDGPYRLTRWEAGSHIEFVRFDDYFLGRPPLDGIIYSFHPDANSLTASLLAGSLDVHLPIGLDLSQASELKRRWEGTGNRVLIGGDGKMKGLTPQFRRDVVRPVALLDRQVREALYRGLDRESVVQAGALGLAPLADSWVFPDDPQRQIGFRDSIVQYPYDPARAQSILEALGWRKGPDGILVNAAGERFEVEIRAEVTERDELAVLADSYKAIGVFATQSVVTPQMSIDQEYRSLYPGMSVEGGTPSTRQTRGFYGPQVASPANRYTGRNKSGYSSPQMDEFLERLESAILANDRTLAEAALLKFATTDLPELPLYFTVQAATASARVRNVRGPNSYIGNAWDLPGWDIVE